jgi:hypothetical protein
LFIISSSFPSPLNACWICCTVAYIFGGSTGI